MVIIYTTIENTEQAESISQTLLEERLAACVNMWPIGAMYTWNNKIEKSTEVAMFLKTSDASAEAMRQRLAELHPYECPAIITLDIKQTHPDFEQWVQAQTGQ